MPNPALNATRHGLLSECPVLDGFETRAAWLAHRQRFWDDLHPRGAVEEALVERIALTFWRMARLARAEVAAAQRHRDQQIEQAGRVWYAEVQGYLTLEEAHAEVRRRDDLCDWLAAFPRHPGEAPVPSPLVALLRAHLEAVVDDCLEALDGHSPAAFVAPAPPCVVGFPESTVEEMRALFQQVAAATHQPLEAVLRRVAMLAQSAAAAFSRSVRDTERQVAQVRATVQLPPEPELQLFTRYDAHLGRELARLFRTLRDLRTLGSPAVAEELLAPASVPAAPFTPESPTSQTPGRMLNIPELPNGAVTPSGGSASPSSGRKRKFPSFVSPP